MTDQRPTETTTTTPIKKPPGFWVHLSGFVTVVLSALGTFDWTEVFVGPNAPEFIGVAGAAVMLARASWSLFLKLKK